MAQTCSKCTRVNPDEAVYCYYDGFVLSGQGQAGGPIAIGSQAFGSPFVFPEGTSCQNFNELALACQENWNTAKSLLNEGYLEKFLGGLGRIDLAMAAKEAAQFPDGDLGLNELLEKFPTDVLTAPTLFVETTEVNLGQLSVGDTRTFDLHLENRGMRLLHGTVSCSEGVWLTLGDKPGIPEKRFQFQNDTKITVGVVGDKLRAGSKPLGAKLLVETNGGQETIVVSTEVRVKAFPTGLLAGATSPREVAVKAKANPKGAAPFFESGQVNDWYKSNGWTYPVEGPPASGMGAIQQFFEALGLVKAPKVTISDNEIRLSGDPGGTLSHSLKVATPEKKHVYAHGVSSEAWLEVSRAKLGGRSATIDVSIPRIPDRPGETLTANLRILANGNQRINIPVHLTISGTKRASAPVMEVEPVEVEELEEVGAAPDNDFSFMNNPAPAPAPVTPAASNDLGAMLEAPPAAPARTRRGKGRTGQETPFIFHLIPAGVLALAVLIVVIIDLISHEPLKAEGPGDGNVPNPGEVKSGTWDYDRKELASTERMLTIRHNSSSKFGIEMTQEKDPKNEERFKKLTRERDGSTNNTVIKLNGSEFFFGNPSNSEARWIERKQFKSFKPDYRHGKLVEQYFFRDKITVAQHVELVPGRTGLLDTVLVYYKIKNEDEGPVNVGLRVMLDTLIGSNDGVPFMYSDKTGTHSVATMKEFENSKLVPNYVEVIENPSDPDNLGTVVRVGLKGIELPGIGKVEPIDKMLITRWQSSAVLWNVPLQDIQFSNKKDSSVALYWKYTKMNPGTTRHMAFTYGLSEVDITGISGGTPVGLSAPAAVKPNEEFIITGYVWNAPKGQEVTLTLPSGMSLVGGESATKQTPDGKSPSTVSWRVKASKAGTFTFSAKSKKSQSKPYKVRVKSTSIFG